MHGQEILHLIGGEVVVDQDLLHLVGGETVVHGQEILRLISREAVVDQDFLHLAGGETVVHGSRDSSPNWRISCCGSRPSSGWRRCFCAHG